MITTTDSTIRIVVFEQGDRWVAQCLDFGLAISAARREDLPRRVQSQLLGQLVADLRRGVAPFSSCKPAPTKYWAMYETAEPWLSDRLREPLPVRLLGWFRRQRLPRKRLQLAAARA